jgi:hypothetical protein
MSDQEPKVPDHIAPEYRQEYLERMKSAQANTRSEPLIIFDQSRVNLGSADTHLGASFITVLIFHSTMSLRLKVDQMDLPKGVDRRDLKLQAESQLLRSLAESASKGQMIDLYVSRKQEGGDLLEEGVAWAIDAALDRLKQEEKMGEAFHRQ